MGETGLPSNVNVFLSEHIDLPMALVILFLFCFDCGLTSR